MLSNRNYAKNSQVFSSPDFAIKIDFPNGQSAQLAVGTPSEVLLAGDQIEQRRLALRLGTAVIVEGAYGGIFKGRTQDLAYTIKTPQTRELSSRKGTPAFSFELRFDSPLSAIVKMTDEGAVEVSGNASVLIENQTDLNIRCIENSAPSATRPETTASPPRSLVSVEEYVASETGYRTRKNPDRPLKNHTNTLVALWRHTADMVESVVDVTIPAIERMKLRPGGTINVHVECVTNDDLSRARLDAILGSPSLARATALFDDQVSEAFGDHNSILALYKDLRTQLERYANERGYSLQMRTVDINDGDRDSMQQQEENDRKSRELALFFLSPPADISFAGFKRRLLDDATAPLYAEHAFHQQREKVVQGQLERWGLARSDNSVNVLFMGAAHRPVMRLLRGSSCIQAIVNKNVQLTKLGRGILADSYELLDVRIREAIQTNTLRKNSGLLLKYVIASTLTHALQGLKTDENFSKNGDFFIQDAVMRRTHKDCLALLQHMHASRGQLPRDRVALLCQWIAKDQSCTTRLGALRAVHAQYIDESC